MQRSTRCANLRFLNELIRPSIGVMSSLLTSLQCGSNTLGLRGHCRVKIHKAGPQHLSRRKSTKFFLNFSISPFQSVRCSLTVAPAVSHFQTRQKLPAGWSHRHDVERRRGATQRMKDDVFCLRRPYAAQTTSLSSILFGTICLLQTRPGRAPTQIP